MQRSIHTGAAVLSCAALTFLSATDAAAQERTDRYAGYDSGDAERLIVVSESGTVTLDRDGDVYQRPLTRSRLDTASTRAVDRQRQGLTRSEQQLVRETNGTSARIVRNPRYHEQAEVIVAEPLRPAYAEQPATRLRVTTPRETGISRPEGERPGINRPYEPSEDRDVDLIIREQRRESLSDRIVTNPDAERVSSAVGSEAVDPYAGYASDLSREARVSAAPADTAGEPLGIEPLSDEDMAFLERDGDRGDDTEPAMADAEFGDVEDVDVNAFAGHATDFRRSAQPVRHVTAHAKRTGYYRDRYRGGYKYHHRPRYDYRRYHSPTYRYYHRRYYHRRHYYPRYQYYPRYRYRPSYRGCYSGGYYGGGYGYYGYGGSVHVGYRSGNWKVGVGIGF